MQAHERQPGLGRHADGGQNGQALLARAPAGQADTSGLADCTRRPALDDLSHRPPARPGLPPPASVAVRIPRRHARPDAGSPMFGRT